MLYRLLPAACVALALALVAGRGLDAGEKGKEKSHDGKVVSVKDGSLTMESNGKEHTHKVPATAKVTCDGKECKLTDLKAGVLVRVTTDDTDRVTAIAANTKKTSDSKKEKDK